MKGIVRNDVVPREQHHLSIMNCPPPKRKYTYITRRRGIDKEKLRVYQRQWARERAFQLRQLGLSTSPKRRGLPILHPRYTNPFLSRRERANERHRRYRQRLLAKGLTTRGTI